MIQLLEPVKWIQNVKLFGTAHNMDLAIFAIISIERKATMTGNYVGFEKVRCITTNCLLFVLDHWFMQSFISFMMYSSIERENCTCTGVANEWGHGATCQLYNGYSDDSMNGVWCYAETSTCSEATSVEFHRQYYVEEGRFGPSKKACSQYNGKIIITIIKVSIRIKSELLWSYLLR